MNVRERRHTCRLAVVSALNHCVCLIQYILGTFSGGGTQAQAKPKGHNAQASRPRQERNQRV